MPFFVINKDIKEVNVECIVCPINETFSNSKETAYQTVEALGKETLRKECFSYSHLETGTALITEGQNFSKSIIQVAVPRYGQENGNERNLLEKSYLSCLDIVREQQIESVAFPLISSKEYGYPNSIAYKVAKYTIIDYLEKYDLDTTVFLFVDDKEALEVNSYKREMIHRRLKRIDHTVCNFDMVLPPEIERKGYDGESFSRRLLRIIDTLGLQDPRVYHKANITRKLFSKLRKSIHHPSKPTVIALCISLELNLKDTNYLLESAGYILTKSIPLDRIIIKSIKEGQYDIFTINENLSNHDLPWLGSK